MLVDRINARLILVDRPKHVSKYEWCYTTDEITEATDEVIRIKNQREESNRALIVCRQAVQRVKDAGAS